MLKWNEFDGKRFGRDLLITLLTLGTAAALCVLLRLLDDGDIYVSMIFLLAVAVVARLTDGYFWGIASSVIGVVGVNVVFTAPYFKFSLSVSGYPLSFASMLAVSVIVSAMTAQIRQAEKQRYRVQVEEMRANLLRAISHDLRTPLTSISGAASVLLTNPNMERPSQEKLLREIGDDADWLVRMVENLLSITRINASETASLHKVPEAAEEVIAESVRKFRKRFPQPPVEIRLPDELVMAPMDAILIEQVLTNLLENVARHADADKITLTLSRENGACVFEVADDGCGIPPRRLPTIFDSVSESDGSRCMGIGLSVCRAIILAHGGKITAENNAAGGATFRFSLPMEEEPHDSANNNSDY